MSNFVQNYEKDILSANVLTSSAAKYCVSEQ